MLTVRKLPVATSLYLDIIRFSAAVMVAAGHLTQKYFSVGWQDHTTLAVKAVGVFFVLSGFVIRYTTRLKYHNIGEYWVDRSARIYSVVLPAVLFTIVADLIAWRVNPTYYLDNWSANTGHPLLRLVTNLTFTSQVWSKSIALFSNGPFWSLSYECFYYVLYGCAFYLTGLKRQISWLLVAASAGPHIMLLLPLWLLGCAIFDLYQWLREHFISKRMVHIYFAASGIAGTALWHPAFDLIFLLKSMLARFFLAHHHQPINLRWTLDYYGVGIPAAFLLVWSAVALEPLVVEGNSVATRAIRFMSEGTFALYLFHFPAMVLIAAVLPYDHGSALAKLAILLAVIAIGISLASPTNHLKNILRCRMRRRFIPEDAMSPARPLETV